MIISLILYSVIALIGYHSWTINTFYGIDKETYFMYVLILGWTFIFAYNVYKNKRKEGKHVLDITIGDILPLLYKVIGLIVVIGVLIIIVDNLPKGWNKEYRK
jgi:tryptophan-rich sensory protein